MSMTNFLDGAEVNPIPYLERDKALRDDLIVAMLAMLQDLHDGYPWRELGIDMDEIHANVAELGIEHEVSRGAKWQREAIATAPQPTADALGEARELLAALANRWQDEAARSWGETKEHATLQRCADELRALLAADNAEAPGGED